MKKIVITRGMGSTLSYEARKLLAFKKGIQLYPKKDGKHWTYWTINDIKMSAYLDDDYLRTFNWDYICDNTPRDDIDLVATVEELGDIANGSTHTELHVVEIPDDIDWYIAENDEFGGEWVAEKHRTWWYIDGNTVERQIAIC